MASNFGLSTSQYIIDTLESEIKRLMTEYCARLSLHISKEFNLPINKVEIVLSEFASSNLGSPFYDGGIPEGSRGLRPNSAGIISIPKPSRIPEKKIPKNKAKEIIGFEESSFIKNNVETEFIDNLKIRTQNLEGLKKENFERKSDLKIISSESENVEKIIISEPTKKEKIQKVTKSCQRVKQRQTDPCGKPAKRTILFNDEEIWVCGADKSGCYFEMNKKINKEAQITVSEKNSSLLKIEKKGNPKGVPKKSSPKDMTALKNNLKTNNKEPPKIPKKEKGKMSVSDVKSLVPTILKNKGDIFMKDIKIKNKVISYCEGPNQRMLAFDKKSTEFYGVLNGENILPLERMDVRWIESKGHYAKIDSSSTQSKHISRDTPKENVPSKNNKLIEESEMGFHKSIDGDDGDEGGNEINISKDDEGASLVSD